MGKPNIYGIKTACIPNSKADMHRHRKIYDKGREIAARTEPRQNRRERRALARMKGAIT